MKRTQLIVALLFSIIMIGTSITSVIATPTISNLVVMPTVKSTGVFYKWRDDVNSLADASWKSASIISNDSISLLDPVITDQVLRIRMGGNFTVTLKASAHYSGSVFLLGSYSGDVKDKDLYIQNFSIEPYVTYTAYYYEGNALDSTVVPYSSSGWKVMPTSNNNVAPMFMTPSKYSGTPKTSNLLQNGAVLVANEWTDMQVLPKKTAAYGGRRPDNPYFYLGGAYYYKPNGGTVDSLGYKYSEKKYMKTNSSTGLVSYYPKGTGITNDLVTMANEAYKQIGLGAEIETSLMFTKNIKPGTIYTIRLDLTVPYQGYGYMDGSVSVFGISRDLSNYPQQSPLLSTTQRVVGAFRTPAIILPVRLTSFNAIYQNGSPKLAWTTASETNNKGFYIQRSTDATTFTNVGYVVTKSPSGSSSVQLNYTYRDLNAPSLGVLYYRLMQEDVDGAKTAGPITSVSIGGTPDITIVPNPVIYNMKVLNAEAGSTYVIYNESGQVVKTGSVSTSTFDVPMSYYPTGIYFLKLTNKSGTQITKKFLHR